MAALKKYKKPIIWFLAPIVTITLAYIILNILISFFSLPPLLKELPESATATQEMMFNVSYLLALFLMVSYYILLPICWIIGIVLLFRVWGNTPSSSK